MAVHTQAVGSHAELCVLVTGKGAVARYEWKSRARDHTFGFMDGTILPGM
jgi:hypothetical protein